MNYLYTADNPPPGHMLEKFTKDNLRCLHCVADENDKLCRSTACTSKEDRYVIVKLTLRHYVAEATK